MITRSLVHSNPEEIQKLWRVIDDPQDLNEALVSVAYDNAVAQILKQVEQEMAAALVSVMTNGL